MEITMSGDGSKLLAAANEAENDIDHQRPKLKCN